MLISIVDKWNICTFSSKSIAEHLNFWLKYKTGAIIHQNSTKIMSFSSCFIRSKLTYRPYNLIQQQHRFSMGNGDYQRKDTDSPCIGTCSTVRGDQVCIGCYRTVDEIMLWHKFSDDEKRAINNRVLKQQNNSTNDLE